MPLELRIAGAPDAEKITRVINRAFAPVEGFFLDGDRITQEEVFRLLRVGYFVVAVDSNNILGCVYVEPRGERAYLGLLSVEPTQQHAGLGSQLLTAAEEHCANLGCRFMDMKVVNLRSELPEYYRKRGYREIGTSPFPAELKPKRPCWFIDMSKPLVR